MLVCQWISQFVFSYIILYQAQIEYRPDFIFGNEYRQREGQG